MGRNARTGFATQKSLWKGREPLCKPGKGLSQNSPSQCLRAVSKGMGSRIRGFGFFLSGIGWAQGVAGFVRRFIRVGAQANRYHDQRSESWRQIPDSGPRRSRAFP